MEAVVERGAVATRSAKAAPTSKSQGAADGVAADHKESTWRDAALAARNSVSTLLFEATVRDEEERNDSSGMAKRLMAIANSEIGELAASATKKEFESAAFNVEAMLQGALALSDDPVGPEVRGMLTHALVIIDRLTDVLCGGFGIEALTVAIDTKPSPAPSMASHADFLDAERRDIVRMCGGEVMDWVSLIRLAQEHATFDGEAINRLMPQILHRIDTLGSIVLSGMGDQAETTEALGAKFDGETAA